MDVKIRDLLNCLDQEALTQLIRHKGLTTSRFLDEKRKTLAYSYRGNLKQLIEKLRKKDLINISNKIGFTINEVEYSVPNLVTMRTKEIKDIAIDVFCEQSISERMVPIDKDSSVKLYSNKYSQADTDILNIEVLQKALRGTDAIYIASAYYDIEFYKKLFKGMTKKFREIKIIFNGLWGQRLKKQKEELDKLHKILKKKSHKAEIKLVMENGIFHTKLYLFKGRRKTSTFVGSMNSTNAGLEINEEILVNITGNTQAFERYFNKIWEKAEELKNVNTPMAKSLIGFFRTGILYFKPEYQIQLTYNPFFALWHELTADEREKIVGHIPNSEPGVGIGAFSLPRSVGLNFRESKDKKGIKPYCIETNLGYWVPSVYEEKIKVAVNNKQKRDNYNELKKAIEENEDEFFIEQYKKYRDAAKKIFEDALGQNKIEKHINKINDEKQGSLLKYDPFNDETHFKHFFDKIKEKITDPEWKYINKLCKRFISGPLPEIWDDYAAYADFKESFFEYIEFLDEQKISRLVPKEILKKIESNKESTIEGKLASYLKASGWHEEYWPKI